MTWYVLVGHMKLFSQLLNGQNPGSIKKKKASDQSVQLDNLHIQADPSLEDKQKHHGYSLVIWVFFRHFFAQLAT